MLIDYFGSINYQQTISIPDVGSVCLRCYGTKDTGEVEYYVMTKAIRGFIHILKFGPVIADMPELLRDFEMSYEVLKFNDKKIEQNISKYINSSFKRIYNIELCEPEEAFELLPNIEQSWQEIV